ncbi:YaaL family protein [Lentibacillus juripiscarius]|uniref:YaaL family protein n=1 Tax=Lentibacillus juripiscarius TaxID=257446 RepID=A0ABW5V9Q1_9BACI
MRRKKKKRGADEQLLDAIVALENEWKQIQAIVEKSIEPTEDIFYRQNIARENYLFLLREAKRRKISAIRYNK